MKVETRYFDREEKRILRRHKAIIVHWDAGGISNIHSLRNWMNKRETSYHVLISRDTVLKTIPEELRAIHAGHKTYTDFAKKFFGKSVCSKNDSPNNYTLAGCILHDKPDGDYYQDTIDLAAEYFAGWCFTYGIDPMTHIIRHSDITDEKATFCPKYFENEELFIAFKKKIRLYLNAFYINTGDTK